MGTFVNKFLFVLCCVFVSIESKAIHTSGKLDFGDSPRVASLVKNEKSHPVTISRALDSISSPSEITSKVSCGLTGCNSTRNNNSVDTEIIVHVQTKVNFDQSQGRKVLEESSDVPIVVGYRGSTPDETPNDEQFRNSGPDISERRYGSPGNDYTPFRPLYSDSPSTVGFAYNQRTAPSTNTPYYGSSTYRPPTNGYDGSSITPTSYGYYEPARSENGFTNDYFRSSTSRPLDLNDIHSPLPISIPHPLGGNYNYNYKENGVELQIPYFEHTYNKHYFREDPPPHTVWLGKSNSQNPVEFKTVPRNKWRPSFWNGRNNKYAFSDRGNDFLNSPRRNPSIPVYNQPTHHRNHGTECFCREQRTDRSDGLNSYAASSVNHHIALPSKDPGVAIDDKLAPLN